MNIAVRGLSSEQTREIILNGGSLTIDLMAEVATLKIGGKSKAIVSDGNAKPNYLFDVTAAVAELTAPEPAKPEKTKPAK